MAHVYIWIGQIDSDKHEHYFVNQPSDDDDAPHNQFAHDQGETSFDNDCVEISYLADPMPVRAFVDGHFYSECYLDQVVARAAELGMDRINAFVLSTEEEFSKPTSVNRDGLHLEYLGTFEYDESLDEL
jgi:hypothetical protein